MFMLKKILLFKIAVLYVFVSLPVHVIYAVEPLMPGIDIIELEIEDSPKKNLLSIPWIDFRDNLLNETAPLFELMSNTGNTSATGWIAVTNDEIQIRIKVTDNEHYNIHGFAEMYNGDSLLLGIDAMGDGAGKKPADTPLLGSDDIFMMMALINGETIAYAINSRNGDGYRLHSDHAKITRDESMKSTTYDIQLPWDEVQSAAGISSFIGVALQINDVDSNNSIERLQWGGGASGTPRPGLFNKLTILSPISDFASAVITKDAIWCEGEYSEGIVACKSSQSLTIRASLLTIQKEITINGSDKLRRYAIRAYTDGLPDETVDFNIEILDTSFKPLATSKGNVNAPGIVIKDLVSKIKAQLMHVKDPLLVRHLKSIDALIQTEWNKAILNLDTNPQYAYDTIMYSEKILEGIKSIKNDLDTDYMKVQQNLILAFVSKWDQSLQFYMVTLPKNWDKNKKYPLIVYLHGVGPTHPLSFVSKPFIQTDSTDHNNEITNNEYFLLQPWGRGNVGYKEAAERDIWQTLDDMKDIFKVDEERIYLTGHSMGGHAAWRLALQAPNKWAAVCIMAGGTRDAPVGLDLARNVSYLPIRIWHGEADGAIPVQEAYIMQSELLKYGKDVDLVIVPGQGHGVPIEHEYENRQWLLQYSRKRPDTFSYICNSDLHRGVWGIEMQRDLNFSFTPHYDCSIHNNEVHITSQGTPGININLGKNGLELNGEVVVFWNEEKVYCGPVKRITLSQKTQ